MPTSSGVREQIAESPALAGDLNSAHNRRGTLKLLVDKPTNSQTHHTILHPLF
jgi:hypothetical protein